MKLNGPFLDMMQKLGQHDIIVCKYPLNDYHFSIQDCSVLWWHLQKFCRNLICHDWRSLFDEKMARLLLGLFFMDIFKQSGNYGDCFNMKLETWKCSNLLCQFNGYVRLKTFYFDIWPLINFSFDYVPHIVIQCIQVCRARRSYILSNVTWS